MTPEQILEEICYWRLNEGDDWKINPVLLAEFLAKHLPTVEE